MRARSLPNISFLHAPLDHTSTAITHDMDRVSLGVGAAVETGDRAPRFAHPVLEERLRRTGRRPGFR